MVNKQQNHKFLEVIAGLVVAVGVSLYMFTDNPTLIGDGTKAAIASIELPALGARDDSMAAAQHRTFQRAQETYRKQCHLWHKDCDKIRDLQ